MRDDSAETPVQSFPRETIVSSSGMDRYGYSLPTSTSPILKGILKDGFGEAVILWELGKDRLQGKFVSLSKTKRLFSGVFWH